MTARAVRIITEIEAVDRPFDYALDSSRPVGLGDRVRVDFNHRSVRGWVIDDAEWSEDLKTVKKWLGVGPPGTMLELLRWASHRWYGSWSRFLLSASPKRIVTSLPSVPAALALPSAVQVSASEASPGVLQLAPTTDPLALILGAYEATRDREGSLLVLVPTAAWASRLRGRLEQRGCAVASGDEQWERIRAGWPVVVGSRGAALAPVPKVAGCVIVDADDEAYRSSAAPTWEAVTMLRERCRRDAAPLWCTSVFPSPALLDKGSYEKERDLVGGWPRVDVVDRRTSDPRDGVLSRLVVDEAHRALEGDEPVAVVVILQRLGTGRLLACATCGELARCARCDQAEEEVGEELSCADRHERRARFCRFCGSTNLKRLRVGVTTLARDVSAQLGRDVSEITASTGPGVSLARVVVGTEATWQRVRRCSLVVFVDFDQYLLAPRASARQAAVIATAKAGRLVGSRRDDRGRVLLQTRRGEDVVLRSLVGADFDALIEEDDVTARMLGLRPYGASAEVSGEGAAEFVEGLRDDSLSVRASPLGFLVRANDDATLSDALRRAPRPTKRLRVAVD